MFWTNTETFKAVTSFLQSVWTEPTGKIFLITVIAYSFSYILYSGYLGWFAGGVGSIPLSQVGFSAIDFFGLIPTVYLLIFQLALKLLKIAARLILLYGILPIFVFIAGRLIGVSIEISIFSKGYSFTAFISFIGTLLWMGGFFWEISSYTNIHNSPKWRLVMSFVGAFLMGISSAYIKTTVTSASTVNSSGVETNIILEIGAVTVLMFVFSLPYFMGVSLARMSVKDKVLSRVQKIVFCSPLDILGLKRESPKKTAKSKTPDSGVFAYHADENHPVYLVSMFNKNTAIFLPSETTGQKRGKLVIISNDQIRLLEIKSGIIEIS